MLQLLHTSLVVVNPKSRNRVGFPRIPTPNDGAPRSRVGIFVSMSLAARFSSHLASLDLGPGRALVAVSGGLDSVSLVDLLIQTRESHGLEPIVAHLDHGISAESADVAARVAQLAAAVGLPFVSGRLELGSMASETAAREARYEWLHGARSERASRMDPHGSSRRRSGGDGPPRVLGGSGPAGLAGMTRRGCPRATPAAVSSGGAGSLGAESRDLWWWHDPANRNPRHLRSWLRSVLLPMVRERIPDVDQRLLDVGRQAAVDRSAWDSVLRLAPGTRSAARSIRGLDPSLEPSASLDENLAASVDHGARPEVRRSRGAPARGAGSTLRASRAGAVPGSSCRVDGCSSGASIDSSSVVLGNCDADHRPSGRRGGESGLGGLEARLAPEPAPARQSRDAMTAWFIPETLSVRSWRAGDRVAPIGGAGHRLAVRCFQEAQEFPELAGRTGPSSTARAPWSGSPASAARRNCCRLRASRGDEWMSLPAEVTRRRRRPAERPARDLRRRDHPAPGDGAGARDHRRLPRRATCCWSGCSRAASCFWPTLVRRNRAAAAGGFHPGQLLRDRHGSPRARSSCCTIPRPASGASMFCSLRI